MCGINGIVGLDDTFRLNDRLVHMNNAIRHRGPDDRGIFTTPGCGLGHVRLSIIDLSPEGHQPMHSQDGRYTLVFNGEIYNYKLLKKQLSDYPYKSQTDTEVILAALCRWGLNAIARLEGMFALAIWDHHNKSLTLARDHMGKKPLYIAHADGMLLFSSEMRGLLASGCVSRDLDPQALAEFFSWQTVHAPNTILKGVKQMMPGTMLTWHQGTITRNRFFELQESRYKFKVTGPYERVKKDVHRLLTEAVEKRMVSDVPLGAFLSGGIDSSIVVALASGFRPGELQTFNIGFQEEAFNESAIAMQVARKFNTKHTEIILTPEEIEKDVLLALDAMDFPTTDGVNTYVVSGAAKRAGITVALSGLGGDELFGGYWMFPLSQRLQQLSFLGKLPVPLRRLFSDWYRKFKPGTRADKLYSIMSRPGFSFGEWYPELRRITDEERLAGLISTKPYHTAADAVGQIKMEGRVVTEVSLAELQTYLPNILLRDSDQMSMAHAFEIRCPFLDLALIDYVLSLPDAFKPLKPGKKLLIDSFGHLLPEEVFNRPKMGFTFPWEQWLRGPMAAMAEEGIMALKDISVVQGREVEQLWHRFRAGDKTLSWARVWVFIVMGHYIRRNKLSL